MKALFIVLLLIPCIALAQQSASVNGYIKDAKTGETLIAANIGLLNTQRGTSSNNRGYFNLTEIEPGTYTLTASFIGYETFTKKVELSPGQHLRLDIELIPKNVQLGELVVESQADKEKQKNIGVNQVQVQLIKKVPAVFEADVFRSLQLLPGVKSSSDFSSGLYIRGGSPDQTLILLDGTTVYNPTHFFGFFSTFNPDAIKDVRLYKGGYPAKYGGRLGSVLTIYNKDGNRNEFAGTATVGLLASRATVQGPFKKGSWMFSIRRSTLDPILAILRKSMDNIPQSFYFLDLNGKVNYDADPDNKFSLAFYSGLDNVNFPFADDARIKLNYGNQTGSANWSHIFSDKVFSNFKLTGSRYFNFPSFAIAGTPFKRSNNIFDFSAKGDVEYVPNNHHKISTGFWAGLLTLKLNEEFDGEDTFSSRIHTPYGSFYVQDDWQLSQRWKLTPGVRLSGFGKGSYWRLGPRLSAEFKPNDNIRLQAAYGRYNQFLTLITNEAFSGFDTWLTTDNGVKPAYGDQFVLGLKTKPWQGYGFDVETYYRTMEDLFELDPFLPDEAGLDYDQLFRFGKGYAYGTEFYVQKQIGRLTGSLGYTFSVTRRKYPHFNQPIDQKGGARFFPPKYDRRNDVKAVLSYSLSKRWKTTAVFQYATGQSYTKPLGRTQAGDFPTQSQPVDQLVVGRVNASRLPPYNRLDISFTRKGTFWGLAKAKWQFQIINVYSRRNVWYYNFDFDKNPVERKTVQLLPILPNVSYTVTF